MPTHRCFFTDAEPQPILDKFGTASKAVLISSAPVVEPSSQNAVRSRLSGLSVKQALEHKLAVSIPHNSSQDSFAVDNGKIWFGLTPETYSHAGLEARKLRNGRYFAEYDLGDTESKRAQRLQWCLENTLTEHYDWELPSDTITVRETYVPTLPALDLGVPENNDAFHDWANEVVDWAGIAVLPGNQFGDDLGNNEPAIATTWEGPLSSAAIRDIYRAAADSKCKWFVLVLQGYACFPVAWQRPHAPGYASGLVLVGTPSTPPISLELVAWGDL